MLEKDFQQYAFQGFQEQGWFDTCETLCPEGECDHRTCKRFAGTGDGSRTYEDVLAAYFIRTYPRFVDEGNVGEVMNSFFAAVDAANRLPGGRGLVGVLREGFPIGNGAVLRPVSEDPSQNTYLITREFPVESDTSPNRPDLVLSVNGIPLAGIEVKYGPVGTTVADAEKQWNERDPENPLYVPNRRMLDFVSLDEERVTMAAASDDDFVPFERDDSWSLTEIPDGDYASSFLWKRTFTPAGFTRFVLDFIQVRDSGTGEAGTVQVARYFQQGCVEYLMSQVRHGLKGRFLVQHSTGGGKTLTAFMQAEQLTEANMREAIDCDKTVVASPSKELDQQTYEEFVGYAKTGGALHPEGSIVRATSKRHLHELLTSQKYAHVKVICTTVHKLAGCVKDHGGDPVLQGLSVAIIIDEAHYGTDAKWAADIDLLLASSLHFAYFAYTATPKEATARRFGHGGVPHHLYSQGQAEKEGIVLPTGTEYHAAVPKQHTEVSAKDGFGNEVVPAGIWSQSAKQVVRQSPEAIAAKGELIVRDFKLHHADAMGGLAKGMVVAGSVEEALRYKKAFDHDGSFGSVVAFSGSWVGVLDGEHHTWTEQTANGLGGRETVRGRFRQDAVRLIIVVAKFRFGFNEPKLEVLYLDRKLKEPSLITQLLSRLNRPRDGKQAPRVVDFYAAANKAAIEEALARYHDGFEAGLRYLDTGELEAARERLEEAGILDADRINRFGGYAAQYGTEPAEKRSLVVRNMDIVLDEALATVRAGGEDTMSEALADIRLVLLADKDRLGSGGVADAERQLALRSEMALLSRSGSKLSSLLKLPGSEPRGPKPSDAIDISVATFTGVRRVLLTAAVEKPGRGRKRKRGRRHPSRELLAQAVEKVNERLATEEGQTLLDLALADPAIRMTRERADTAGQALREDLDAVFAMRELVRSIGGDTGTSCVLGLLDLVQGLDAAAASEEEQILPMEELTRNEKNIIDAFAEKAARRGEYPELAAIVEQLPKAVPEATLAEYLEKLHGLMPDRRHPVARFLKRAWWGDVPMEGVTIYEEDDGYAFWVGNALRMALDRSGLDRILDAGAAIPAVA